MLIDNGTVGVGLIIAYIDRYNQKNSCQIENGRVPIFAYSYLVRVVVWLRAKIAFDLKM